MNLKQSRRKFIQNTALAGLGLSLLNPLSLQAASKKPKMKLGLVTYLWGQDWDLPT